MRNMDAKSSSAFVALMAIAGCVADTSGVADDALGGSGGYTYIKAQTPHAADLFGSAVALSADGLVMVIGAPAEDLSAGIEPEAGAVSVYVRASSTDAWKLATELRPTYREGFALYGSSVALSADGSTLVVGAKGDSIPDTQPTVRPPSGTLEFSGAAYVYTRAGAQWNQRAYLRAEHAFRGDNFGEAVAVSADGSTVAVGAPRESSSAHGVNGNYVYDPNKAGESGAAYVYSRSGASWGPQAYIKASNADAGDWFGSALSLSGDGKTLAVGALMESSGAKGVQPADQASNSAAGSGALYVFTKAGATWSQQAYIKASNAEKK